MGDQNGRPEDGFAPTSIEVDVNGLSDFRALLGREVDANLRPGAQDVLNQHAMGPRFGARNPGSGTMAAKARYNQVLEASTANLQAYLRVADMLIDAMAVVVANLRETDDTAGVTMSQFYEALGGAAQHQTISGSDPNVETDRESHRQYAGSGSTATPATAAS